MTEVANLPVVNGTTVEQVIIVSETTNASEPTLAPANGVPIITEAANGQQKNGDEGAKVNGDTPATNGAGPTKAKKEPEPPKDPKEDTIGWLKQQHRAAIHKANFYVMDWLQKTAIEDESKRPTLPLKGGKEEAVTRGQFLAHLKDGQLLAHLANKLVPGSVETVHEGEAAKDKTNQTANIEAFINFVKGKAGFTDEQVFSVEDLQERGKAGYEAVMNTLFQLGLRTQDMFSQSGFELGQIVEEVQKAVDPNLFQKIVQAFVSGVSAIKNTKFTRSSSSAPVSAENGQAAVNGNSVPSAENGVENGTTPMENGAKPVEELKKETEATVASQ